MKEVVNRLPTVPDVGRAPDGVVISRDELTVMARAFVAVTPMLSTTCTVKGNDPELVAVPEIVPVLGSMELNPGGSEPEITDQV